MTDLLNEQISALVDGELPPEETALLLRRLEREPELAKRYARYQALGDLLRGEAVRPSARLTSRIGAAIEAEAPRVARVDPVRAPRRRHRLSFLKPVAGLGLAAAVGALAVMLVTRAPETGSPATVAATAVPVVGGEVAPPERRRVAAEAPATLRSTGEPASYVTPALGPVPGSLRPIGGATLANYVAAHARLSGSLGGRDALIHLVADPSPDEENRRP